MNKITIPEKLAPVLTKKKRFKIAIGGRGSGKSQSFTDAALVKVVSENLKVGCFREFMNSIDDSVFSLIKGEISRLEIPGFELLDKKIKYSGGEPFSFKGLARNIESIKSMHGFDIFWIEEAQTMSQKSIEVLTPTLRKEGSEIWLTANPTSSQDPFSKRFIVPFQDELDRNGYYEDDLHIIIVMNYSDNPWFPDVLEKERREALRVLPRSLYDHIWEGAFNDSVENSLILAEWFDACVDAHKRLGIKPKGAVIAAHDPSDTGGDSKGLAIRHGILVNEVYENNQGDINEGGDWATGLAISHNCDYYTWDCDGMGVGLNRQTAQAFQGKKVTISMFKGSESPDNPKSLYEPTSISAIQSSKTWDEVARNKRAQYYMMLRDKCYKTYLAVTKNEYQDPEELISFNSDMQGLSKLRSELCRMPIKPNSNGKFELYRKDEMKSKFNLPSPNLADSVMMTMRSYTKPNAQVKMPRPIRANR